MELLSNKNRIIISLKTILIFLEKKAINIPIEINNNVKIICIACCYSINTLHKYINNYNNNNIQFKLLVGS